MVFTNWAGNQTSVPAEVRTPASTKEVVRAVQDAAASGRRLRMIGTGHSFTGVALTDGILLRPGALTGVISWHDDRVTVRAGTPLRALNELLDERGLALANMGDITEQTVAGAIQTGTHGTGRDTGGLADQVTELELVLADGSVVTAGPGEDLFDAARVGLGALGVLTSVTFRVEPAFLLRNQRRRMALSDILGSLDAMTSGNEHLDFFWLPHTDTCLVKTMRTDNECIQAVQAGRTYRRDRRQQRTASRMPSRRAPRSGSSKARRSSRSPWRSRSTRAGPDTEAHAARSSTRSSPRCTPTATLKGCPGSGSRRTSPPSRE